MNPRDPNAQPPDRSEPPPRGAWNFIKRIASQFSQDQVMTLSAATSFYAALALAPLIVVLLAVVSIVWERQAAADRLIDELGGLIGEQGAEVARTVIAKAAESQQSGWAAALGMITLLLAATGLFAQLQDSLNHIWNVRGKPGKSWVLYIRKRFLSLGMILVFGFLLLLSTAVSAAIHMVTALMPFDQSGANVLGQSINFVFSLAVFSLLFTAMFKYLPDAKVPWRTALVGGLATAVLFAVGKQLIGLYLGRGSVGSAYGAAGSLVVVLAWVYYSSIILFVGAEFTQVYAAATGHEIEPSRLAEREPVCDPIQPPRRGRAQPRPG